MQISSFRHLSRSIAGAFVLLACTATAFAADTYNIASRQLAISAVVIGSATYNNMLVTVGAVFSGPTGTTPNGAEDSFNPINKRLNIPAVTIGTTTYYNAVATVSGLVSIGTVTGADSYSGGDLSISSVQIGGTVYSNVVITVGSIVRIAGGMPSQVRDSYDAATNQLAIPAVVYAGRVYTNVTITVGKIRSVGGPGVTVGVTVSTSSISFGTVALQSPSIAQSILVSSSGTGPLPVGSIAVSGANRADFLEYNNCPGVGGLLSAGASCFINAVFTPSTTASESATLTITDSASGDSQTVALSGQGVAQAVTVTPTAVAVEVNHSVPFVDNLPGLGGSVTWSTTVGSIDATGLYTAPGSVPTPSSGTVTVTSLSDPSLSASAAVTIVPATASVVTSPHSASVQAGGNVVLKAAVVDNANTAVTWRVNGVVNGNSAVGTIALGSAGSSVATYTAPSIIPATNPVIVTATSTADPKQSDVASLAITAGTAISVASIDKTTLQPFNLLTLTGAGFNPRATLSVNFSDSTGYSVNVPPVFVSSNAIAVAVPPYISIATGDFATGAVIIKVSQTSGGSTVTSNTVSGLQILDLPPLVTPPGAFTLALLEAQSGFTQQLMTYLSYYDTTSALNTPEMNGALNAVANELSPLIAQVSGVVQNPTSTFVLGVASGTTLTVGSAELSKADRMILGMLSAQRAAGYVDAPEPDCQFGVSVVDPNALLNSQGGTPPGVGPYSIGCAPFAVTTTLEVVGGSAGIATGGAGLMFGAEATATVSAAVSSQLTYITTTLGLGLTGVGGMLGQGSAYAQQLVQSGGEIINDYLKDAVKGTIVSKTFGEATGRLFDLAVDANELMHAFGAAPPSNGGPSEVPTNTLTVVATGTGSGTVVSYPGGIVCGSGSTACIAPFPVGETVYLDSQQGVGSLSGACSGTGVCTVVMNSSQSVTAAFGNTVTPSSLFLGTTGGCAGGSLSGSFQVTAPPGVSWTVSEAVSNPYAPATLSASSGSGSGSVTITVHALPQTPTSGFTCSDTLTYTYGGTVFFNFSDSTFVDPHANYTYYAVD